MRCDNEAIVKTGAGVQTGETESDLIYQRREKATTSHTIL